MPPIHSLKAMSERSHEPPEERDRERVSEHAPNPWPRVVLWVLIVGMVLASGLYVFRTLVGLPGDAVRAGRELGGELLSDFGELIAAFEQGEIETRFASYAASVSGNSYLQFATLGQTEVYTRSDSSSVLWGRFALPDVVVAATAPVEYTYYLDLEEDWRFEMEGNEITVYTPEIQHNRPAIDASRIHFDVRESSVFRDEELAIEELKQSLSELSDERAVEHVELVREIGRAKIEQFVKTWLAAQFGDGTTDGPPHIEVVFPDELEGPSDDDGKLQRTLG